MSGVNEDLGNEVLSGMTSGKGIVDFLSKILTQTMKQNKFEDKTQKAMKTMLEHIKGGGQLRTSAVTPEESQIYEKYLKAMNVPYVRFQCSDQSNSETKVNFVYRDIDEALARQVKEKFLYETGIGLKEMELRDFVSANKDKDILIAYNLDRVEIEVLKQNIPSDVQYSVTESKNTPGKFNVLYNRSNKEVVKNSIKDMFFDLAGAEGEKFRSEVSALLDEKDAFDLSLVPKEGERIFVVDKECPTNFISVQREGFSTHSLDINNKKKIFDKNSISVAAYNRETLMKYVSGMSAAVILSADEFKLVEEIGTNGEAIPIQGEDFYNKLNEMKKTLESKNNVYKADKLIEPESKKEPIHTFEKIPAEMRVQISSMIENNAIKNATIMGDYFAFSDKEMPFVKDNIMPLLYPNTMSDLKKFEAKMLYEGRGKVNLTTEITSPQFLLDGNNPRYMIELQREKAIIREEGKEIAEFDRNSPDYAKQLEVITKRMQNPVALSLAEMKMEQRRKQYIIQQRMNYSLYSENIATRHLRELEKIEKMALHDAYIEENKLTPRQAEALEKAKDCDVAELHVDKAFYENIMEESVDKKLENEKTYSEVNTTFNR